MHCLKINAPPSGKSSLSTEVKTAYFNPSFLTASETLSGSLISSPIGLPDLTAQYLQALVHISPNIIKVAVLLSQHSPILGHFASAQTVFKEFLFIKFLTSI